MRKILITVVAVGLVVWGVDALRSATTHPEGPVLNQAFERVMQTGVIRCGYAAWDPMLKVDPTTKEVSGLAHDVIEAAAKYLDLKVEWVEEVGWGEFNQALQNQRFDVFCAGGTPSSERAKVTLITQPFVFADFRVVVRKDDHRFSGSADRLNQPDVRFGQIDGTTGAKIVRSSFPRSEVMGYPQTIPFSQLAIDVANRKIDATLIPRAIHDLYSKSFPRILTTMDSLGARRLLPSVFFVNINEPHLRDMLNVATAELLDAGAINQAILRHQTAVGAYLLPAKPYQPEPIQ